MHARDRQSKCMPPYYGLLHSLDVPEVISCLRLGYLPCIVVYHWWAALTALSLDWDTMGVVWVVRDSFPSDLD